MRQRVGIGGQDSRQLIGPGQEALCGNGKIPPGSLGLLLISSAILLVGLGVAVWGGLALRLREGYGECLLFWYGGRFNSIRGMVDLLWPMGDRSNGSSFVIVASTIC